MLFYPICAFCLLIEIFWPLTFKVTVDMVGLKSTIFVFVLYELFAFVPFFLFFFLLCIKYFYGSILSVLLITMYHSLFCYFFGKLACQHDHFNLLVQKKDLQSCWYKENVEVGRCLDLFGIMNWVGSILYWKHPVHMCIHIKT